MARTDPSVTTLVIQALVAIGGLGGFASIINAVFSRRRNQAEAGGMEASAAKVITDAAASLVQPLEERIRAQETRSLLQETRIRELEAEVESLRSSEAVSRRREQRLVDKLHEFAAWAAAAFEQLTRAGIPIAPTPRLDGVFDPPH